MPLSENAAGITERAELLVGKRALRPHDDARPAAGDAARDVGPIAVSLKWLDKALEAHHCELARVSDALSRLGERLEPILHDGTVPAWGTDDNDGEPVRADIDTRAPLARKIDGQARNLAIGTDQARDLVARVNAILEAIEL